MSAWVPETTRQFDLGRRVVVASDHYQTVARETGHVSRKAKAARSLRDMAIYDAVKVGWPKSRITALTGLDAKQMLDGLLRAHKFDVNRRMELRIELERMAGA